MTPNERKHLVAWLVVPAFAVANGAIRDLTYGRVLGATLAHSLAVLPLVLAILVFAVFLARRWPLLDRHASVRVGLAWLVATLAFEFGLGLARGVALEQMLAQYNVLRGHLWPLAPLTMALAPEIARVYSRRDDRAAPRPAGA